MTHRTLVAYSEGKGGVCMAQMVIAGGDRRQDYLCEEMKRRGWDAKAVWTPGTDQVTAREGLDLIRGASVLILPLPVSRDGETLVACGQESISVQQILEAAPARCRVFGGQLGKIGEKWPDVRDYYEDESLLLANAVSTAESAVGLTILTVPFLLRCASCAVAGCGRIGKELAVLLKKMGSDVTVFARSAHQRAWCADRGIKALPLSKLRTAKGFQILYNTIPARILFAGDPVLEQPWYMELASAPGGCDGGVPAQRYIAAPSLPGRFAPETAAADIAAAIDTMLGKERR